MKLVPRADWGARNYRLPSGATLYAGPRRGVKLHYLGTAYADRTHDLCDDYVRKIQAQHMDGNGWSDIGYSFLVCSHGYVYEGRGLRRRNSANGSTSLNEQDYAICLLVGSSGLTKPPEAQLSGARDAIDYCRAEGPAGTWLGGHRDGYATSCPGDAVYAWVKAGAPRPASSTPAPKPPAPAPAPTPKPAEKPAVDLSRLVAAAKSDPARAGTPVTYSGTKLVEAALVKEGLLAKSLADGHFGSRTVEAYAAWQKRLGYSGTAADGIPGRTSLSKLGAKYGFTVVA